MTQVEMILGTRAEPFAAFSEDRIYRYQLFRPLIDKPIDQMRMVLWVMLNPSTADESVDDNTIKSCKRISLHHGFEGMFVGNLYAYRSTDPKPLARMDLARKTGPENAANLRIMATRCQMIICAWGVPGDRAHLPAELAERELRCLGITKGGNPCHPLYFSTNARLFPYEIA